MFCVHVCSQVTAGFLFTVVFFFPTVNFPMRICIHFWLFGETDATQLQHVLETVIPFTATLILSLFVNDVGVVFGLIGSVETCSTFFLFPAGMILCRPALKDSQTPQPAWLRPLCYVLLCFGACFLVLGVITTLYGEE
jgi:hypothetical protein